MAASDATAPAGPVALIGCGQMGGALADGWLASGLPPASLWIVEPDADRRAHWSARGAQTAAALADIAGDPPKALVLAVKPQAMDAVLPTVAGFVGAETLVLSIAAGTPIHRFEKAFGGTTAIVRAMPNTPAAVGRGITALVANGSCNDGQRRLADQLMGAAGATVWLAKEDDLHAVTALSGGGPAYVFLLIEALAAAGMRLGLDAEVSEQLARATVEGAGELAFQRETDANELRQNVTSPGGTTAEALKVLMQSETGLQPLVDEAVAAAARRSRELAAG